MNYSLQKNDSKIKGQFTMTLDSSYHVVFNFDYKNFHSWTKEDDIQSILTDLYLLKDDKEMLFEDSSKDVQSKILTQIYSIVKEEFEKEATFLKYHYTGQIRSDAYDSYLIKYEISKYPVLIKTFESKSGETISLRQSGDKLKYVKKDENKDILRDENGMAMYLSDEEMIEKGLNRFDTAIVAFNSKEISVGLASDEFGADGIWVNPDHQKQGIGFELLTEFRKQFKSERKIGQMTESGIDLVRAYYRKEIRKI